jgi:creatinine amidohydrolase/Fe(II)-dependent formamide hydrolase-like protein
MRKVWNLVLPVLAAFAVPNIAHAAQTSSVFLEDLTSPELQRREAAGATTILIPIGGTEQSGPNIALGKHNVRVKILSGRIAAKLGNAIVAPVIAYVPEGDINPPTQHMRYPGTISISRAAFQKTLEDAARSFKQHGFKDIVFLGDHGGYQADIKIAADALDKEWGNGAVRAHALPEYYGATQTAYVAALEKRGFTKAQIGVHAGLADVSLMLATDPALVRVGSLSNRPADGVVGDPKGASAELGQIGVDAVIAQTVEAIKKAQVR